MEHETVPPTGDDDLRAGYFWPIWPILGWGIGLGFHAWGLYGALGRQARMKSSARWTSCDTEPFQSRG